MPTAILIWVWLCAYLNCVGWVLSALHQLNAAGYMVALLIGFVAFVVWWKQTSAQIFPQIFWRKLKCRFRRPFPLAFLILAAMAFLGGAWYAPNNYDALTYRIPRVLHWLAVDQWHWIHTDSPRLNNRSCGIEWVSAPFIALLKTDRPLFLINIVSFLLLPGLVFSVFTRLGVRQRVAWHWMWIAPTGYSLLLQAGSIGNDLFGAPFALAAVDFAMRAKTSRAARDFFASILAVAMLTGAKTSSLPLVLPWAVAILPSFKLVFRWPLRTLAVCAIAIFASALPTMFLNAKFYGDWSGVAVGRSNVKNALFIRSGASAVLVAIENFVPPVFPLANRWNDGVARALPPKLAGHLEQVMEAPGCKFHLDQMQIEENAGLGFGVCVLLLASVVAAKFEQRKKTAVASKNPGGSTWQTCVRFAPAISFFALITQANLTAIGRIATPYYLLLLPALLAGAGHERLIGKCWWRALVCAVFVAAGGLLIVSPARPLFPVQKLLKKIQPPGPDPRWFTRVKTVYSVYGARTDAFEPARAILPADANPLGLITASDDPEASLWRPFGSRRILHVCHNDTPDDIRRRGIHYVLVSSVVLSQGWNISLDEWLSRNNAEVVQRLSLKLRAGIGPTDWLLVRLRQ
jgi:hypothetical protein